MYILRLLSFQVPTSYSADIINLKKKPNKQGDVLSGMTNGSALFTWNWGAVLREQVMGV